MCLSHSITLFSHAIRKEESEASLPFLAETQVQQVRGVQS